MSVRSTRRIVVTGLGVITPLGTGVDKTWKAICAGESGIGRITKFDPAAYDAQIAGEVKDFDPAQFIEKKEIKKMDTFIHYAVAAAQLAVDDAGFTVAPEEATKVGVYIGSGIGGLGVDRALPQNSAGKRPRACLAVFYSDDHHQPGVRAGGDQTGRQGAELLCGDGLCDG